MNIRPLISATFLTIFRCSCLIYFQQPYEGQTFTDCYNPETYSKSILGYTCNGASKSCQTFLTFRSRAPYNTVAAISNMLASDPSQLAEINSVSETATFETNKLVIVPITCSCSGEYYQLNSSHVVVNDDTFLIVANNTLQGLSTCQAMLNQNSNLTAENLQIVDRLTVPLRCACPTKNQTDLGFKYLLTYLIAQGDYVSLISNRFGSDAGRTLEANGLSEQDSTILPFTTLLVPLKNPPHSSQTVEPPTSSRSPPAITLPPSNNSNKTWIYALVGAFGGGGLLLVTGAIIFFAVFHGSTKKGFDSITASESFEALEKPQEKKVEEEESQDFLETLSGIAQSLKVYKFEDLQRATDGFSTACLIKGSVYCTKINEDLAAIKKMNGDGSSIIVVWGLGIVCDICLTRGRVV